MRTLIPLLLVVTFPLTLQAETYTLKDGKTIKGSPVGEADGALTVLAYTNDLKTFPKADVVKVDPLPALPKRLRIKLKREKSKWFKKRQRKAKKLIRQHDRAKTDAEREVIVAKLEGFKPPVLCRALNEGLKSRKAPTRDMALGRLKAMKGVKQAIAPLVRAAIIAKHKPLRPKAHAAAVHVDRELTRRYYHAIAASRTKPSRRVQAIDYLGDMGDRAAVPQLIGVLENVEMEIRATLATASNLRRVPVNLGTTGNAALQVPIELPEMQIISVATKISVPTLRAIAGRAGRALNKLTGEDFGAKSKPWKNWWDNLPDASKQVEKVDK